MFGYKELKNRIAELEGELTSVRGEVEALRNAATMRIGEWRPERDAFCDHRKIMTAMDVIRWWMKKEGVEAQVVKASPERVEFVKKE